MTPTLRAEDFVLVSRRGRIRRGSLVVVRHPMRPGWDMVKRVRAVPGDRLGGGTLGRDQYWVVGDDPSASTDSRDFGAVGRRHIEGVARAVYWPVRRARLL